MTTVIIPTIRRETLLNAIESARREGLPIVVVSNGKELGWLGKLERFVILGKDYGHYGAMPINVAALVAETEFVTRLDDDDELAPGAGKVILEAIRSRPDVDIWISGCEYSNGERACMDSSKGVTLGNIAWPTYRTSIFTEVPFTHALKHVHGVDGIDAAHVQACAARGYKVEWLGKVTHLVRPKLTGKNGYGA